MTTFLADLLFYVFATFYFVAMGGALLYGLPRLLIWCIRSPSVAQHSAGSSFLFLVAGTALISGIALYLGSAPLGAMPCGPRFPCPAGAEFVHIAEFPFQYMFKAAPLAVVLLFSVSLVVLWGRPLFKMRPNISLKRTNQSLRD
jgi:hypothetical protein